MVHKQSPQRILITGGAGFIGSSLASRLAQTGDNITICDSLLTGSRELVPEHPNIRFVKGDANEDSCISSIMTSTQFDVVFHYAAVVGVARTLEYPTLVLSDIQGIRNVLELCKNTGVKRVFFSSSSEVYGEPVEIPQREATTPLNARLPYAVVKSLGECFCRAYQQEHQLPFTILRFFNTYGPKQSADFVISKFIDQAYAGEDITIYGDGQQTRTFCYIDDNVDFTRQILKRNQCVNSVVNVGHHDQVTIKQLAETIIELTGSRSKVVHLPALPEGDMRRRQPDNGRMLEVLGRELVDLRAGIQMILEDR